MKGQALETFVAEFADLPTCEQTPGTKVQGEIPTWKLFIDGSSNKHNSRAGLILITLEGHQFQCALRFGFIACNNEVEYEALLVGLRLANDVNVKSLEIYNDSQLFVNQILGEYQSRWLKRVEYLNKAKDLLVQFKKYTLQQAPHNQNFNVDALAKLASSKDSDMLNIVPVEHLSAPNIHVDDSTLVIHAADTWMTPIIQYLDQGIFPTKKNESKKLQRQPTRFILVDGILYR
ncbi:uncharacterized protein LOC133806775 [Humulus lupulus]|uniref:uncharacterized protein LOC133806775 n=1 Tax=Humulus lupulus TaxID=3486 RepID=UPI002B40551E|nr:uncharacterized protein LOC133806775 [Humulus lupulus]